MKQALAALFLLCAVGFDSNCLVTTDLGTFRGIFDGATETCSFKNLSYTEPFERLAKTKVKSTKYEEPIFNATEYGPICWQYALPEPNEMTWEQSEDCLSMNIYVPDDFEGKAMPVMVWIHGGGFYQGAARIYDGKWIARTGVIVVTFNYRLGAFGFFTTDGIGGMNGIIDQVNALRYVQHHIRHFGGDPNQVTIFGESAGGISVCLHLHLPISDGLFSKAIVQSGACYSSYWMVRNQENGIKAGHWFLDQTGMTESYFNSAPIEDIVMKSENITDNIYVLGPIPAEDKLVLPSMPIHLPLVESLTKLMIGHTTRDLPFFAPPIEGGIQSNWTRQDITNYLDTYFDESFRERVWSLYPSSVEPTRIPMDMCTTCPMARLSLRAESKGIDSYSYIYDWPTGYSGHAADLDASWNFTMDSLNTPESLTEIVISLNTYFASFGKPQADSQTNWRKAMLLRDSGISETTFVSDTICNFWNEVSDSQIDLGSICVCLSTPHAIDCGSVSTTTTSTSSAPRDDSGESASSGWMIAVICLSIALFVAVGFRLNAYLQAKAAPGDYMALNYQEDNIQ